MSHLLLVCLVLFAVSSVDWYVSMRKGLALIGRSPALIGWVSLEVILGGVVGFGLFDAYQSKSVTEAVMVIGSSASGAALGCLLSGAVQLKGHTRAYEARP